MKIYFLGTSSGSPSLTRNVSATGVQFEKSKQWLLVDCGEGTQHQILKSELSVYRLGVILITHMHGDHCYGLPGLIASMSLSNRQEAVHLVAPEAVINFVKMTLEMTQVTTSFEIIYHPWESLNTPLEFQQCAVKVHTLKHRVPCVGFEIIEKAIPNKLNITKLNEDGIISGPHYNQLQQGHNVTYQGRNLLSKEYAYPSWRPRKVLICGDNEKPSLLDGVAQHVDMLVHEATFTHQDLLRVGTQTGHSDAKRVAEFAQSASVAHLVLFHFSSRYHGEGGLDLLQHEATRFYDGKLTLAYDGLVIEVEKVKN